MSAESSRGHSAAFFTEGRDYWWNADFLRLVVERLGLDGCRSMLDVGCGLGHWARAIGQALPRLAAVVGLDADQAWVEQTVLATTDSVAVGAVRGTSAALPFPDAGFDLTSCQTVLIHVADPAETLREMRRVTRPGGIVLVAEPSNRASQLVRTNVSAGWPVERILRHLDFYLRCEQGKTRLGLGDNSVGDLLPGYFAEAGLEDLMVFMSDKSSPLWPPYEAPDQRAALDSLQDNVDRGDWWGWTHDEAHDYFIAGGGSPDAFEDAWAGQLADLRTEHQAALTEELTTAGGQLMYLVAGHVPT